jgi:hypothetical protein
MKAAEETETEIEILWRQWAPGAWRAILTNRSTKEQREVKTEAELLHALAELCQIAVSVES